jgi:hypothetical protein
MKRMKTSDISKSLVPTAKMVGEDHEETEQLRAILHEAKGYLLGQKWCRSIRKEYFGLGVGEVVGVFLFEIDGEPGTRDALWVVAGDLPSAYLVTDAAPTATAALAIYCSLMDDWVEAVREKGDLSELFPIPVEPTEENAAELEGRLNFLRSEIIPAFESCSA